MQFFLDEKALSTPLLIMTVTTPAGRGSNHPELWFAHLLFSSNRKDLQEGLVLPLVSTMVVPLTYISDVESL